VTSVTEGQRVVVFRDFLKALTGCYAEYVVADEGDLIPVAEWVDLDEAAAFPLAYLTAFHALHTLGHLQAGHGADLILDSVAGAGFASNFDMLAPLGLIIWFGAAAGFPEVNITELMGANLAKGPGVRLFRIFNSIAQPYPELFQRTKLELAELLGEGKIKPYIFRRMPLSNAVAAHALIEGGTTVGKIILKP